MTTITSNITIQIHTNLDSKCYISHNKCSRRHSPRALILISQILKIASKAHIVTCRRPTSGPARNCGHWCFDAKYKSLGSVSVALAILAENKSIQQQKQLALQQLATASDRAVGWTDIEFIYSARIKQVHGLSRVIQSSQEATIYW